MNSSPNPAPPLPPRGQVITFYSYKGGTGRTMALANVGALLAERADPGRGVLLIDWDLEAPGLPRYFPQSRPVKSRIRLRSAAESETPGVIDLARDLLSRLAPLQSEARTCTEGEVQALLDRLDLDEYLLATDCANLFLLPAGRCDAGYAHRVNTFDWESLHRAAPQLFRGLAERLAQRFDFVLIDSRTGETDTSGICTMLMPEKLVAVFTPNLQSVGGVLKQIRLATEYRRDSDDARPLAVFPLASRVETAEPTLRDAWRFGSTAEGLRGFEVEFEELFRQVYGAEACELREYFDHVLIQHVSAYAYGEQIAVRKERSQDRLSLTGAYTSFAERLVNQAVPWERRGAQAANLGTGVAPGALLLGPLLRSWWRGYQGVARRLGFTPAAQVVAGLACVVAIAALVERSSMYSAREYLALKSEVESKAKEVRELREEKEQAATRLKSASALVDKLQRELWHAEGRLSLAVVEQAARRDSVTAGKDLATAALEVERSIRQATELDLEKSDDPRIIERLFLNHCVLAWVWNQLGRKEDLAREVDEVRKRGQKIDPRALRYLLSASGKGTVEEGIKSLLDPKTSAEEWFQEVKRYDRAESAGRSGGGSSTW
ncbi:MAG: hypothetical protein HZA54_18120 [Planctomycetes bacterium]|nr:hypothetical protein [Planctomycetota bacterium]